MISHHSLSMLFLALATAVGLSMCCPIGQCVELPSPFTYFSAAQGHNSPLQARVNISTRTNPVFQPQTFQSDIRIAEHNLPVVANGCNDIFNITSSDTGIDTPCPWQYQCDYNPQRIPAMIFTARCDDIIPQGSTNEEEVCGEVYYPVTYITTTSCDPIEEIESAEWSLVTEVLPVACSLQS